MKDNTEVAKWLAGELNDNEIKALVGSQRFATFVRIRENFDRIQKPQINNGQMLEKIFQHEKNSAPKVIPLYRRAWVQAVAASVVLLIGIGIFFTSEQEVAAAYGETYAFALPDKSEVILNAGSKASYRDFNWDGNRSVALDGEAYFKVAKGERFAVETPLGTVTVMGTQFNVKARGNRLDVVCYEGKVRVAYNKQEVLLTANQSISIEGNNTFGLRADQATQPQWLQNELVFSHEKISGVIQEIERHYNVTIKTDYRATQPFSGPIPGDNLDQALRALSVSFHLEVMRKGDIIILTPVHANQ